MEYYGNTHQEKKRKLRRRIKGLVLIILIVLIGVAIIGALADRGAGYQGHVSAIEENRILKEQIAELEAENARLKAENEALSQTDESDTEEGTTPRN